MSLSEDDEGAPIFELIDLARIGPAADDVISSCRRISSRADEYEVWLRRSPRRKVTNSVHHPSGIVVVQILVVPGKRVKYIYILSFYQSTQESLCR